VAAVLDVFSKMLNLSLILLQLVPPLCDYKVWIDIERGVEAKCYLCNMVELNMMEEEFCAHRMAERKPTTYLPCIARWLVRTIKTSERRSGHGSARKHDV
jgi:hypothetical protein